MKGMLGPHELFWENDRGHTPLRILRQVHGGASDAVPLLPRGGSTGATVSPRGAERAAGDSPRPSLYTSRSRSSLFCRRLRQSHSGTLASVRPSPHNPLPHAAVFPRRPGGDSLRPLSQVQILIHDSALAFELV